MSQIRRRFGSPTGQVRLDKIAKALVIPKHRKLELRVMETVWLHGPMSTREVMESFPEEVRPAYFTVRSIMDQLQSKNAIRLVRTVRGSQIFEAVINPNTVRDLLIDDFAELFASDMGLVFARLIHTGRLTLNDLQQALVGTEFTSQNG
jgi:predicted transcriptional regulator